jgi:hypothetical protein
MGKSNMRRKLTLKEYYKEGLINRHTIANKMPTNKGFCTASGWIT